MTELEALVALAKAAARHRREQSRDSLAELVRWEQAVRPVDD